MEGLFDGFDTAGLDRVTPQLCKAALSELSQTIARDVRLDGDSRAKMVALCTRVIAEAGARNDPDA